MTIKRWAINEIAWPNTAFGIDMPKNAVIYDRSSNVMFEITEPATPSSTLNTLSKDQIWWEDIFTKTITFTVTAPFTSWEVIDITTGTGSISGTSTRVVWDTWAVDSLWVDSTAFELDASLAITDNKTIALKNTDVVWQSSTSLSFSRDLAVGEWFIISDWETSGWLGNISVSWLTNTWTSDLQGNVTIWGALDVTGNISKTGSTVWSVVTFVNDTASSSTINLVTAVGKLNQSFTFVRTDISSNTTTLDPDGTETINNNLTFTLWQWESITLISDNSNWFII